MENSMIPAAGKRRDPEQRFRESMQLYDAAIRSMRTRLEVLDNDFRVRYDRNPIHHIDTRLKSPSSIAKKLERKGLPVTVDAAEENLTDIAGVRVVCNYIEDIYSIAELLIRQSDVELVRRSDYISGPKESGYRSLHLVLRIPVYLTSHTELVPVEIQIRTIAMDFWASLEHELRYKSENSASADLRERLRACAETSAALDMEMQRIFHEIRDQ